MIVLDTDVVSVLMRAPRAASLIARLEAVPVTEQATTTVTLGELAYGAAKASRPQLYEQAKRLLDGVVVLDFDTASAEAYGRLRARLESLGRPLADPDLRIAAIVLANTATLVTGNVRHFARVADLHVENWLQD